MNVAKYKILSIKAEVSIEFFFRAKNVIVQREFNFQMYAFSDSKTWSSQVFIESPSKSVHIQCVLYWQKDKAYWKKQSQIDEFSNKPDVENLFSFSWKIGEIQVIVTSSKAWLVIVFKL